MREEADRLRIEQKVKEMEAAKAEMRAEIAMKRAEHSLNYLKTNNAKLQKLELNIAKNFWKRKNE